MYSTVRSLCRAWLYISSHLFPPSLPFPCLALPFFTLPYKFSSPLHSSSLLYYPLLPRSLLYSTLFYFTLLYSTLLYSTLLYFTLLYSALFYSTLLPQNFESYFTLSYFTSLSSSVSADNLMFLKFKYLSPSLSLYITLIEQRVPKLKLESVCVTVVLRVTITLLFDTDANEVRESYYYMER